MPRKTIRRFRDVTVGFIGLALLLLACAPAPAHAGTMNVPLTNNTLSTGLVGYWTFDGKDTGSTYTTDRSGNNNTGTLTNGPKTAPGKIGQALSFDGVGSYVDIPTNEASFDFANTTFTVSAWFNTKQRSAVGLGVGKMHDAGCGCPNGGWAMWLSGDVLEAGTKNGSANNTFRDTVKNYSDGKWHLATFIYTTDTAVASNNTFTLYVDGVIDQDTPSSQNVYVASTDLNLNFGRRVNGHYFNGSLDDVRIYNRALTAGEVKRLYAAGGGKIVGTGRLPNTSVSSSGLVGYWKFDEGSGTTAADSSGQGNTGTLTNGPTWVAARSAGYKKALQFDGTTKYVDVGNPPVLQFTAGTNSFTLSAWFKKIDDNPGKNNTVMQKQGTPGNFSYELLGFPNGTFTLQLCKNQTGCNTASTGGAVSNGVWHHAVGVYTASTNGMQLYIDGVSQGTGTYTQGNLTSNNSLFIGNDIDAVSTRGFNGSIDDVRIYNRALSATEVKQIYAGGASTYNIPLTNNTLSTGLVGYWTMDGKDTGSTYTIDKSGNNNTGTLTNGPKPVPGKIGQALSFNGVNSYVITPLINFGPTYTLSGWIKTTQAGPATVILNNKNSLFGFNESIQIASGLVRICPKNSSNTSLCATSVTAIADNKWHFILGTVDWNNLIATIYVDGKSEANQILSGTRLITGNTGNTYIGIRADDLATSPYYNGTIDDVRIYNRALTQAEITRLYAGGR